MTALRALRVQAAAAVALAALSLLVLPGAPTYDPFAWIIWGREITEGALVTTAGPSWKPLPVAITTVLALTGSASPWLWLIVARAGALGALVAIAALVRRLGGGWAGAAAAVVAVGLAPWWGFQALLGNSEGLMVLCVAASLERLLAGQHRTALLLGAGAALLRPEAWPFLGLYGVWLLARRQVRPAVVVGVGLGVLACWTLPEWWGSGDPLRAASRARTDIGSSAPTNADHPLLATVGDAIDLLSIPVLVALAAATVAAARGRDRVAGGLLALGAAWLLVVAVMTSGGFSGNERYLFVPVVLLVVVAAAWLGAALQAVPAAVAVPLCVVVFAIPSAGRLPGVHDRAAYEAQMTWALPDVIDGAGGAAFVRGCGVVSTGRFLVPQVAWFLHLHQRQVSQFARAPGTVFGVRTTATSRWGPPRGAISPRPVATDRAWRVYQRCAEGRP